MKEERINNVENVEFKEARLEEIDLRSIILVLRKWRWYIILIILLSILSAGVISFFVIEPVYEASTSIMVVQTRSSQRTGDSGIDEAVADLSRLPEITINNVIRQIRNPEIMSRVIGALQLDREIYSPQGLLNMTTVQGDTDTRSGGSSIIDIKVEHTDPAMAAALANTIREQYLEFISEKNYEQMSKSLAFLSEQIEEAEKNLNAISEELKEFDEQPRGVFFLEKEINSKADTLNQYRASLSRLVIEYERALAAQDLLRDKLSNTPQLIKIERPAGSSGEAFEGEEVESALGAWETVVYQEINPVYISLSEALSQKETEVAEKQAQIAATEKMIAQVQAELDLLQAEYTEKKTRRDRIVTQLELTNRTYNLLSEKFVQVQIYQAVEVGQTNFLTLAEAEVPKVPVKPRKELNMAIAGVLGLMVGVFLAFFLEMLDNTIKTPDDVQKHLGLPVLATVPLRR